jgi:hypothetical protein
VVSRHAVFATALVTASLVGAVSGGAALASASPPTPPNDSSDGDGCYYSVSAPQLVELPGGAKAVKSTIHIKSCAPSSQPTDVTVCVSTPDGPGQCKRTPGWSSPEVLVTTAHLNGTFTATGQLCWQDILQSFRPNCRDGGPVSTTI